VKAAGDGAIAGAAKTGAATGAGGAAGLGETAGVIGSAGGAATTGAVGVAGTGERPRVTEIAGVGAGGRFCHPESAPPEAGGLPNGMGAEGVATCAGVEAGGDTGGVAIAACARAASSASLAAKRGAIVPRVETAGIGLDAIGAAGDGTEGAGAGGASGAGGGGSGALGPLAGVKPV
jgi:hypothetical protein